MKVVVERGPKLVHEAEVQLGEVQMMPPREHWFSEVVWRSPGM